MLLDFYGQLCWNSSLATVKDYSYNVYIGGAYLTIVQALNGITLVCSSNSFSMSVESKNRSRTHLRKAECFAVTERILLVVASGVMYSTTMQDIVYSIRNNLDTVVLRELDCQDEAGFSLHIKSFQAVDTTLNEAFVIRSDGMLCKFSIAANYNSASIVEVNCTSSVRQVSCGNVHCIVLTNTGLVFSAGIGSHGQLGHGDLTDLTTPKRVEPMCILSIVCISAGGWHSAFLTSTGDLYMCGWNESMQLGIGNNSMCLEPEPLDLPPEICNESMIDEVVCGVSCGIRHTVLWTERNTIFCLGGSNSSSDRRKVFLDENFKQVTVGHKSSFYHGHCAIACKSFDFGFFVYYQSK